MFHCQCLGSWHREFIFLIYIQWSVYMHSLFQTSLRAQNLTMLVNSSLDLKYGKRQFEMEVLWCSCICIYQYLNYTCLFWSYFIHSFQHTANRVNVRFGRSIKPAPAISGNNLNSRMPSMSEDFWSTSTCDLDELLTLQSRQNSFISTTNHNSNHGGVIDNLSNHSDFVNHGKLRLQSRHMWSGSDLDWFKLNPIMSMKN